MIPEQAVRQIQDRIDIVELIGGYLPLKKAGRHFKANCPFHPEKTPSFMVNPTKQIFHCFGCGEGGDAITFVMKYEHLEFPEAVRSLAPRVGVEIPVSKGTAPTISSSQTQAFMSALEFAAGFFQRTLNQAAGAAGKAYLEKRGVLPETIQNFRLGFAPDNWEALLKASSAAGIDGKTLDRVGLAVARENGSGWYDRFRGRLMFPVWDPKGKVVGFGGRVLDDSQPKYMNSPETEIYIKSRILYGLHWAAPYIREKDSVIIVEGYMDFLVPFQAGICNVVASMGTSLTADQVHLLRRYTHRVTILYDGDYAGELATLRGLDLLLSEGMQVRIATLPAGEDPDTVVKHSGAKGLQKILEDAQDLFVYKLFLLRRRFDPQSIEGKVAICEQMLPTIKRVPNAAQASEYIRMLSEILKLREEDLRREIGQIKLEALSTWKPSIVSEKKDQSRTVAERILLGLVMDDPRYLPQVQAAIAWEMLQDTLVQAVFLKLWEAWETSEEAAQQAIQDLKHDSSAAVVAEALIESERVDDVARAVEDCLRQIRKRSKEQQLFELQDRIRSAEAAGDEHQTALLIGQMNSLIKTQDNPWR